MERRAAAGREVYIILYYIIFSHYIILYYIILYFHFLFIEERSEWNAALPPAVRRRIILNAYYIIFFILHITFCTFKIFAVLHYIHAFICVDLAGWIEPTGWMDGWLYGVYRMGGGMGGCIGTESTVCADRETRQPRRMHRC